MPKTVPVPSDAAPTAIGRPPVEADLRPFGHLRGMDGLRAVAVIAVVVYHAGLGGLSGGFLGVEVFFVISGFLITALLLAEHRTTGRIDPVAFWLRRGRRLLPALFFLLASTLAFATFVVPDEVARLRADAIAAVAYVTNWHLIAGDQSYFESIGRPSLFIHLWSLAIEEQFYLVWPLVLGMVLLAGRRVALAATLLGAAGSAVWMALQFDPAGDPSRVYYGTDTRLTGLLLGAALAFVWVPPVSILPSPAPGMSRRKRRKVLARVADAGHWGSAKLGWALDVVGVAALAGLAIFFVAADAFEPFLYQGGLALLALITAALIAAAVHPRAHVGRLLDLAPLRWVGTRSYSIYLWHWPIFALTRPELDLPLDAAAALVLRVALTALAAEVSYRVVETPIRRGVLGQAWARLRSNEPSAEHPRAALVRAGRGRWTRGDPVGPARVGRIRHAAGPAGRHADNLDRRTGRGFRCPAGRWGCHPAGIAGHPAWAARDADAGPHRFVCPPAAGLAVAGRCRPADRAEPLTDTTAERPCLRRVGDDPGCQGAGQGPRAAPRGCSRWAPRRRRSRDPAAPRGGGLACRDRDRPAR